MKDDCRTCSHVGERFKYGSTGVLKGTQLFCAISRRDVPDPLATCPCSSYRYRNNEITSRWRLIEDDWGGEHVALSGEPLYRGE